MSRRSRNASALGLALAILMLTSVNLRAEYLWPLPHGNELSSGFGDWRTRHYHAGLDVRTGGQVGLPVVAPADGFIMRISMSYFGYGKALYFKMDDGNVAVFGHLNGFREEVDEYVAEQQIKSESYGQNLIFDVPKFRYQRGDTICFAGKTGVGAPHLHFEVRTADNRPLNPLAFEGLKVKDTQAPEIRRLRLISAGNDELQRALGSRLEYTFLKKPGQTSYALNDAVACLEEPFWLSVEAFDRIGTSTWLKPIYSIELKQGERQLYKLVYDTLSFDDTYMIDLERNFQMATRGSSDFYNLVSPTQVEEGEGLCGGLAVSNQPLSLIVRDLAGNETRSSIPVAKSATGTRPELTRLAGLLQRYGSQQGDVNCAFIPDGSRLWLLVKQMPSKTAEIRVASTKSPTSSVTLRNVGGGYSLGVVDSIGKSSLLDDNGKLRLIRKDVGKAGGSTETEITCDFRRIGSGQGESGFNVGSADGGLQVSFPDGEKSFFSLDKPGYLRVQPEKSLRGKDYSVEPSDFPLAKQAQLSYRFDRPVPRGAALYLGDGERPSFLGCDIDSTRQTVSAKSYRLGTVSMRVDTIAPIIREVTPTANATVTSERPTIRCRIADNLSGIRDSLSVRIDGRWCIAVYDPEEGTVMATPHFDLINGLHRFEIKLTDRVGNTRHLSGDFRCGFDKPSSGSKKKRGK